MALASHSAAAGLRPTVLMSPSAALVRLTCINTRLNHGRLCGAPSGLGRSFRRSHARGSDCVAHASSQIRSCDGSQGRSPGGSEDTSAMDVGVGAENDPEYHNTDLPTACARGYVKRVQVLLDQGADVNQYWKDNFGSGTPLHFAIRKGNSVELVQLLLERGADLEAKDERGRTALHKAAGQGDTWHGKETGRYALPYTKLLIKAGADIHAQDKKGKTPLHWASMRGRVEVVRLLLKRGADVDARDEEGGTPIHAVAEWLRLAGVGKVVKRLVAAGADINARDKKRNTPLHIAANYSNYTALRQLVKQPGVQLDARNREGLTPVAVAVQQANVESVKILKAAGADMVNPKLHRVPLLTWAERGLDCFINQNEDDIRYNERDYYYTAQNYYRVMKYLKAELGTAAPPSTPA